MLTLNELTRWTGLTLFEMDLHLIALFATSVLIVLKWHFLFSSISILQIFSPLFIASALNFYFLVIVFVRTAMEDKALKRAAVGNAFHFFRTAMISFFEIFICHKLEGELEHGKVAVHSPYWVVMMPLWTLLIALSVHACRFL